MDLIFLTNIAWYDFCNCVYREFPKKKLRILNIDDLTVEDVIMNFSLCEHFKNITYELFAIFDKDIVNIRRGLSNLVFGHVICVEDCLEIITIKS